MHPIVSASGKSIDLSHSEAPYFISAEGLYASEQPFFSDKGSLMKRRAICVGFDRGTKNISAYDHHSVRITTAFGKRFGQSARVVLADMSLRPLSE
jgi:hypothetical protein